MRIQQFVVTFEQQLPVFRPGDEIVGEVSLRLAKSLKIRGVRLHIIGEAFSRWEYGKRKTSQSNGSYIYKDHEKYVDYKETLIGKDEHDSKSKNTVLPKGDHAFKFRYQLPEGDDDQPTLPTSMEGAYGYVRYCVRAVVDRPMKRNQWTLKPFTVLRAMDLNQDPTASEPTDGFAQQKVRSKSCVCSSSYHKIAVSLAKSGYCPGEAMMISAKCENGTSKKVLRTSADLLQVINYTGSKKSLIGSVYTKSRRTVKVVETVRGEGCGGHSIISWNDVPLVVPAVPPSRLQGCNIIDVQYFLRFTAYLKNGKRLWCEAPILVGTEPLTSAYCAYYGVDVSCVVDRSTSVSSHLDKPAVDAPHDLLYTNVDCPPPSYEECVYGGATLTDDEYTMGETVFVPLYRVYHTLRFQTTAIQAYGRASMVVDDLSPYRPIGVAASVQVSESNLDLEDEEEEEDEETSDPLMRGEDSENGQELIERPREPIMFEVHHEDSRAISSASADSPAMMVYQPSPVEAESRLMGQTPAPTGSHLVYDSPVSTPVALRNGHVKPQTPQPTSNVDSDSEDEDLPCTPSNGGNSSSQYEPQSPAPTFNTETVIPDDAEEQLDEDARVTSFSNGHHSQYEEGSPVEQAHEGEAGVKERLSVTGGGEPNSEPLESSNSPVQSLDSSGMPVGAMIPLSYSNESVSSTHGCADLSPTDAETHSPKELFDPTTVPDEGPICVEPRVPLQVETDLQLDENEPPLPTNGVEEPALIVAPTVDGNTQDGVAEPPASLEQHVYENGVDSCSPLDPHLAMSYEHDFLHNGHAATVGDPPRTHPVGCDEELAVDVHDPESGGDGEMHSNSTNGAEFFVNQPDSTPHEHNVSEQSSPDKQETSSYHEPPQQSPTSPSAQEQLSPRSEQPEFSPEPLSELSPPAAIPDHQFFPCPESGTQEDGIEQEESSGGSSPMNEPIQINEGCGDIAEASLVEEPHPPEPDDEPLSEATAPDEPCESKPLIEDDLPTEKDELEPAVVTEPSSDMPESVYSMATSDQGPIPEPTSPTAPCETFIEEDLPTEKEELEPAAVTEPSPDMPESVYNMATDQFNPLDLPSPVEPAIPEEVDINDGDEPSAPSEEPAFEAPVEQQEEQVSDFDEPNTESDPVDPECADLEDAPENEAEAAEVGSESEETSYDDGGHLSEIEEENPLDLESASPPPPVPVRTAMDYPPPPIPSRAPAEDLVIAPFDPSDEAYAMYPNDEPLSPIAERFGEETDAEASPNLLENNPSGFVHEPADASENGSYEVNPPEDDEPMMQDDGLGDTKDGLGDAEDGLGDMDDGLGNMDDVPHEQEQFESDSPAEDEELLQFEQEEAAAAALMDDDVDDGVGERGEAPRLPERQGYDDEVYVPYGPGVSDTLVSEHAENDDNEFDMNDLIGSQDQSLPPPAVDRNTKPTADDGSMEECDPADVVPAEEANPPQPADAERAASDDGELEERDCFGGDDSAGSVDYDSDRKASAPTEEPASDDGTMV